MLRLTPPGKTRWARSKSSVLREIRGVVLGSMVMMTRGSLLERRQQTGARAVLNSLKVDARAEFDDAESVGGDIDHGQVGIHTIDGAQPRERIGAGLNEFGFTPSLCCAG